MKKHPLLRTALLVMTAAALLCVSALAVEDGAPANSMYGTFWALVPPVIAITLALITKEICLSNCLRCPHIYCCAFRPCCGYYPYHLLCNTVNSQSLL